MLDGTQLCNEVAESFAGRERDSMLDREETVQIACGELRWKGARQLDGWETVEIVCGELC